MITLQNETCSKLLSWTERKYSHLASLKCHLLFKLLWFPLVEHNLQTVKRNDNFKSFTKAEEDFAIKQQIAPLVVLAENYIIDK